MSQRSSRKRASADTGTPPAAIFAALGDQTRLGLLNQLACGDACSITELTSDTRVTRQAITKHLRVLEEVGLVRGERQGREVRFRLDPAPMEQASRYLADVARLWDQALVRLKHFVESGDS